MIVLLVMMVMDLVHDTVCHRALHVCHNIPFQKHKKNQDNKT